MSLQPVLIAGRWCASDMVARFRSVNPATGEALPDEYPTSSWADCDAALITAVTASVSLRTVSSERLARFLTRFADRIEARTNDLVAMAHAETGLPKSPRLAEVELPRTTTQLRLAASAAREGSWMLPTIDSKLNIRSMLAPIGPVLVFGPNNFPFAFNSAAGGDFAAAIATGNPVIAKANTSHPGTSRLLAEEAHAASNEAGLPAGTFQLIYRTSHADGERLVSDPRVGAIAYTGSRAAGLRLKRAADTAGKPIYLELSSINPVVILPGALAERCGQIASEFVSSCLLGTGQFCTSPSLILLHRGKAAEQFITDVKLKLETRPTPLLSAGVQRTLGESVQVLLTVGAEVVTGGMPISQPGYFFSNTLLRATGAQFLTAPTAMQTEIFGNVSLVVVVDDSVEALRVVEHVEGNLTGSIYSDTHGSDDEIYNLLVPPLRARVGRLLNDKMPTGVAVSPAMNHGGPFPATGHPGFTAVGIPASLRRFGMLQCFDNVRHSRLPAALQDANPNGSMWRLIDGRWTQDSFRI